MVFHNAHNAPSENEQTGINQNNFNCQEGLDQARLSQIEYCIRKNTGSEDAFLFTLSSITLALYLFDLAVDFCAL